MTVDAFHKNSARQVALSDGAPFPNGFWWRGVDFNRRSRPVLSLGGTITKEFRYQVVARKPTDIYRNSTGSQKAFRYLSEARLVSDDRPTPIG
jgi:hypothetical protein